LRCGRQAVVMLWVVCLQCEHKMGPALAPGRLTRVDPHRSVLPITLLKSECQSDIQQAWTPPLGTSTPPKPNMNNHSEENSNKASHPIRSQIMNAPCLCSHSNMSCHANTAGACVAPGQCGGSTHMLPSNSSLVPSTLVAASSQVAYNPRCSARLSLFAQTWTSTTAQALPGPPQQPSDADGPFSRGQNRPAVLAASLAGLLHYAAQPIMENLTPLDPPPQEHAVRTITTVQRDQQPATHCCCSTTQKQWRGQQQH
jgi:hypothetical protein